MNEVSTRINQRLIQIDCIQEMNGETYHNELLHRNRYLVTIIIDLSENDCPMWTKEYVAEFFDYDLENEQRLMERILSCFEQPVRRGIHASTSSYRSYGEQYKNHFAISDRAKEFFTWLRDLSWQGRFLDKMGLALGN